MNLGWLLLNRGGTAGPQTHTRPWGEGRHAKARARGGSQKNRVSKHAACHRVYAGQGCWVFRRDTSGETTDAQRAILEAWALIPGTVDRP